MGIFVEMDWEKFQDIFGEVMLVKRFSKPAQKAIFKQIEKLQKESDKPISFRGVFVSANEKTSAEVYKRSEKAIYNLGGPLLDVLLGIPELAKKTDIPIEEDHPKYDENRTDYSYLEEHYELLLENKEYLDAAIPYINDKLDHPYTKLSNGKWLAFDTVHETYAKTEC